MDSAKVEDGGVEEGGCSVRNWEGGNRRTRQSNLPEPPDKAGDASLTKGDDDEGDGDEGDDEEGVELASWLREGTDDMMYRSYCPPCFGFFRFVLVVGWVDGSCEGGVCGECCAPRGTKISHLQYLPPLGMIGTHLSYLERSI